MQWNIQREKTVCQAEAYSRAGMQSKVTAYLMQATCQRAQGV